MWIEDRGSRIVDRELRIEKRESNRIENQESRNFINREFNNSRNFIIEGRNFIHARPCVYTERPSTPCTASAACHAHRLSRLHTPCTRSAAYHARRRRRRRTLCKKASPSDAGICHCPRIPCTCSAACHAHRLRCRPRIPCTCSAAYGARSGTLCHCSDPPPKKSQ